jgi:hypothetical protein
MLHLKEVRTDACTYFARARIDDDEAPTAVVGVDPEERHVREVEGVRRRGEGGEELRRILLRYLPGREAVGYGIVSESILLWHEGTTI